MDILAITDKMDRMLSKVGWLDSGGSELEKTIQS